ncbi:MAG: aspartate kinase, partial [Gammaproteobacteria bacterium]
MPKPCTWVVKLGGSLLHHASFAAWLAACAQSAAVRCVVVVGGGPAADEVRALHARWQFDERLAHALAIAAMRGNAAIAHALAPTLEPFTHTLPAGSAGALWLPPDDCAWLAVPASWAVTSDSLAVALA